jgi:hypothetical protein
MAHAHEPPGAASPLNAAALEVVARDLKRVFGERITSLVAYGDRDEDGGMHTLALVDSVAFNDLAQCAPLVPAWHRLGLATPLILTRDEFRRTLDVFPLEYGDILSRHVVLAGSNPFAGIAVAEADLRRGCERQAKSHLIHLREGFLETQGDPPAVARMIAASAPAFRALLQNLERLEPGASRRAGISDDLLREVSTAADATIAEPSALLSRYIAAVERLWQYVDAWRR